MRISMIEPLVHEGQRIVPTSQSITHPGIDRTGQDLEALR
jgi:hypothetical protein